MNKTWKDFKNLFLVLIMVACLVVMGCGSILNMVTPGVMPKPTADYLGDPNTVGITTLDKLVEAKTDVIVKHRRAQTDLLREAQDDEVGYKDAIGFIETNIDESRVVQDIVVGSEDQPFSVLGILAGFAGGAAIGRALKRKGDYTPEEVEVEVGKRAKV